MDDNTQKPNVLSGEQEILKVIGKSVNALTPRPWVKTWVEIEFSKTEPPVVSFKCRYIKEEGGVVEGYSGSYDLKKLFDKLRSLTIKDPQNPWYTAKFELYPGGKFTINFGY